MAQRRNSVLVVEDNDDLRELVGGILEREGFHVSMAADGQEALDLTTSAVPDLILLDMRMPRMDGWAFAREYRRRHGQRTPIVVVTAAESAAARAADVGAEGCLAKPFDIEDLLAVVRRFAFAERAPQGS
jgi:CheY-like chemotaxis protein